MNSCISKFHWRSISAPLQDRLILQRSRQPPLDQSPYAHDAVERKQSIRKADGFPFARTGSGEQSPQKPSFVEWTFPQLQHQPEISGRFHIKVGVSGMDGADFFGDGFCGFIWLDYFGQRITEPVLRQKK